MTTRRFSGLSSLLNHISGVGIDRLVKVNPQYTREEGYDGGGGKEEQLQRANGNTHVLDPAIAARLAGD